MSKSIMIGVPVNRWLSPQFSLSLNKILLYLIDRQYLVEVNYDNGSTINMQRNKIMRLAFEQNMDLLFIDSDMIFEADALDKVIAAQDKGDIIGGLCFMRRPPFKPVVFKEDRTDTEFIFTGWKYKDIPAYAFKCAGVGAAFVLIKHDAMKKIYNNFQFPFNPWEMQDGDTLGEDLSFMHRCNLLELSILCVPNVDIGHITERVITYRDHEAILNNELSSDN